MINGMFRVRVALALGLVLVGLLALACTREVEVEVVKEVVVEATAVPALARYQAGGMNLGFVQEAPYGYINDAGECTGLDIDVAREVASRLGIEVQCVHLAWEGLIPGLQGGRIDSIPVGMAIRPSRCEAVLFSDPYQAQGIAALVLEGNPKGITSYDDFVDSDLILAGSLGASELIIAREDFGIPSERAIGFAEQVQVIEAVKTGRADAGMYTANFVQRYVDEKGKEEGLDIAVPFQSPSYFNSGHAFRHDEKEFYDQWNAILADLKTEGVIDELAAKHGFPVSLMLGTSVQQNNCCGFDDGREANFGCEPS